MTCQQYVDTSAFRPIYDPVLKCVVHRKKNVCFRNYFLCKSFLVILRSFLPPQMCELAFDSSSSPVRVAVFQVGRAFHQQRRIFSHNGDSLVAPAGVLIMKEERARGRVNANFCVYYALESSCTQIMEAMRTAHTQKSAEGTNDQGRHERAKFTNNTIFG